MGVRTKRLALISPGIRKHYVKIQRNMKDVRIYRAFGASATVPWASIWSLGIRNIQMTILSQCDSALMIICDSLRRDREWAIKRYFIRAAAILSNKVLKRLFDADEI